MKKKKVLLISGGLLTLILIIISIVLITNNKDEKIYATNERKENVNNFLTLMLEQSDGSYQESTSNTWPGEGYIFNKELSSCQNGGELDYDSENNKVILYNNKSDGCYVYFDLYNKPTINSINLGKVTNNSITITVSANNGTNPISNYYYIINDETPVSTTSNTYTFSGLNAGETYIIKVYVVDSEGYSSDTSSLSVETENPILLADWVIDQYGGVQGNNGIYYHTSSLANSAGDNSYRYSGANPNNYVCFGSDEATCPSDNLYRIIGVFEDEVKLIKSISIGNFFWDNDSVDFNSTMGVINTNNNYRILKLSGILAAPDPVGSNVWETADLNYYLNNDNYLNNIDMTWQNKIETTIWKVGGMSWSNISSSTAKNSYDYEIGNNSCQTTTTNCIYSAKIGLMYVSDYGFAASNTYWSTNLGSYNSAASNNWLYLGSNEWTISRDSDSSGAPSKSIIISYNGGIFYSFVNADYNPVRPCFYLNSDVQYISGSGTESDPIRLKID